MKKLIIAIACVSMMISCKKSETNNVEPTYCCQCIDYHEVWQSDGIAGYSNPVYDTSKFDTCGVSYPDLQKMNKRAETHVSDKVVFHTIYCTVKP